MAKQDEPVETEAAAELRAMTRAALAHPAEESYAAALARLRDLGEHARAAGYQTKGNELRIEQGPPLTAAALAAIEAELGVGLPASCRELLTTVGPLRVDGPNNNNLRVNGDIEELDFDRSIGQVHDSEYYADLYGQDADGYDWESIEPRFVRVALAVAFFEDEDEHEDGDVVTLIVERDTTGEVPVWEVPHDDGYEHTKRGASVHAWFSWAVDRLIRSAYLRWSGKHDELRRLGEAFDDGLADG